MGFFDDDPFDDIIREFFGNRTGLGPVRKKREHVIRGEEEDRVIDFLETEDAFYLIFELPGYTEKEVMATVKGRDVEIRAQKKRQEGVQDYLMQKLQHGVLYNKTLPSFMNSKKFSFTMKNGVLEIAFEKKENER